MNAIRLLNRFINGYRFNQISKRKKFEPEKAILLFCDPRGGSTWLSEILQQNLKVSLIWEPLHVGQNPNFEKIGFGYRQYIPEDAEWAEAKSQFENSFSGRSLNSWTTSKTSIDEMKDADQLMIKFCRGHLLLPWLIQNFDFDFHPIHFVRHPLAVLASMLRHTDWDGVSNASYPIPDGRYNSIYLEHKEFLDSLTSREEVLLTTWCICNQYLLSHKWCNKEWITITYEDMLLDPLKEVERIKKRWGLGDSWDISSIRKPSSTTLKGSPSEVAERLSYWKDYFTDNQLDAFDRIFKYFKLDLYTFEFKPRYCFE